MIIAWKHYHGERELGSVFMWNTYVGGGIPEEWLLCMENPFWRTHKEGCQTAESSDGDQQIELLEQTLTSPDSV